MVTSKCQQICCTVLMLLSWSIKSWIMCNKVCVTGELWIHAESESNWNRVKISRFDQSML